MQPLSEKITELFEKMTPNRLTSSYNAQIGELGAGDVDSGVGLSWNFRDPDALMVARIKRLAPILVANHVLQMVVEQHPIVMLATQKEQSEVLKKQVGIFKNHALSNWQSQPDGAMRRELTNDAGIDNAYLYLALSIIWHSDKANPAKLHQDLQTLNEGFDREARTITLPKEFLQSLQRAESGKEKGK